MASRSPRSLKYEYELYVEREIEDYKDSIPRGALLAVGDEAVAALDAAQQLALTELVLCEEVDRIIRRRLRIPAYSTWRRRRLKQLDELRRPERWGLRADDAVVRAVRSSHDCHVLVAGAAEEATALYLAANGCEVTTIAPEPDVVQRVMVAAAAAGLTERVHAQVAALSGFTPPSRLAAVVCAPAAFAGLTPPERSAAIRILQSATLDGGLHVVRSTVEDRRYPSLDELKQRYDGWDISIEGAVGRGNTFVARKLEA